MSSFQQRVFGGVICLAGFGLACWVMPWQFGVGLFLVIWGNNVQLGAD